MNRVILKADKDFIYTDGEIYGSVICLALGLSGEEFYQIPIAEYEQIKAEKEEKLTKGGNRRNVLSKQR